MNLDFVFQEMKTHSLKPANDMDSCNISLMASDQETCKHLNQPISQRMVNCVGISSIFMSFDVFDSLSIQTTLHLFLITILNPFLFPI